MNDKAIIRSFESGFNGRIVAMTIAAIVVVIALIGFVAGSFRGRDIEGGASAMSNVPGQTTNAAPATPPTAPAR
jgi:hypothetical protein